MRVEQSAFQFTNPILLNFSLNINRKYHSEDEPEIKQDFHVQISRHSEKKEAIVELELDIGEQNDKYPFCISITEGAKFMWNDVEESKIELLLTQNAPALLLGYIRPLVAMMTASSPFGAYHIPFIDFTHNADNEQP